MVSHPSLSSALGLQPRPINFTTVSALLYVTEYLPIQWRKHILTVCRVQDTHTRNTHLQHLLENLQPDAVTIFSPDQDLTKTDLAYMLDLLHPSSLLYSLLSFWSRAEHTSADWAQEALSSGISKELSASQQGDREQALSYDVLSGVDPPTWYNEFLDWDYYRSTGSYVWADIEHVY